MKISKDKILTLLGANASGTHRYKPVIVGQPAKSRAPKDCMHELPVVYYNSTKHAWLSSPIYSERFFKHFVPDVRHYRKIMLRIAPEEAKALLLLDNAPAHRDAEKLACADGKIPMMLHPPSTTLIIQPMDLGVIVSCKRSYQRKYLDEVLLVIE